MYQKFHNRFRQDLIVTQLTNNDSQYYLIKDPISQRLFELKEEEYFLCQLMNGNLEAQEILNIYRHTYNSKITENEFKKFSINIAECNLLENIETPDKLSNLNNIEIWQYHTNTRFRKTESKLQTKYQNKQKDQKTKTQYLWRLPNSQYVFPLLAFPFQPFGLIFKVISWFIIFGVIIASLTIFNHQFIFWQDLKFYVLPIPYLANFIFNLIIVSFTSKVVQGIIFTCQGGSVNQFGLVIVAGFFPRFYIDREEMWKLNRTAQLWNFSSPLLFRLLLFVVGTLLWYNNRTTGTVLSNYALLFTVTGIVDFLLDANPFWPADGYVWMISYFRLPELFERSYLVWDLVIRRRPLPKYLSFRKQLSLQIFGIVAIILSVFLIIVIMLSMANGLAENFAASILSNAADTLLFTAMSIMALSQLLSQWLKKNINVSEPQKKYLLKANTNMTIINPNRSEVLSPSPNRSRFRWSSKYLYQILLLAGFGTLMFLPYELRPGGQIKLLSPKQQDIEADISGKVINILKNHNGFIKKGTVIAIIEANNLENNLLKAQEQIVAQRANIERLRANVANLLARPKKEELEVAQEKIQISKAELSVAHQELNTQVNQAKSSSIKASRYQYLFQQGAISEQQYENEKKNADTDRDQVESLKKNIIVKEGELKAAQANLKLVMSGAYPEEIEAARKEIESAIAELKRLQHELMYLQNQSRRTRLFMPFDGRLITPHLEQQVGRYLQKGDVIAVATANREILGEIEIPESIADKLASDRKVEIKLFALQGKSFTGKVVSIQPTVVTSDTTGQTNVYEQTGKDVKVFNETAGQVVKVLVKIENLEGIVKPGMTGYAKVDGQTMPLIAVFSRSLVRFVTIEMWSWLP